MYFSHSNYFLEVLKKESSTWSTKHTHNIFFYLDYFVYMGSWIFFSIFVLFKIPKKKEEKVFYFWTIISLIFISIIQMKKKRYGLPIYLTSSITIAQLAVYYFRTAYKNLKKSEKILLVIQKYFITFIILGSLILITYFGFIKKEISFSLFFLYLVLHILFLYIINYKKINYAERIIFISGLTMLLINFSTSWILENKFMQKDLLKFRIPVSQEIVKSNFPIYSSGFDIEEVWRIGKQIKILNSIPSKKEIFFLSDEEPKNLLNNYKIIDVYKYQKINHKTTNLYRLERKG